MACLRLFISWTGFTKREFASAAASSAPLPLAYIAPPPFPNGASPSIPAAGSLFAYQLWIGLNCAAEAPGDDSGDGSELPIDTSLIDPGRYAVVGSSQPQSPQLESVGVGSTAGQR